MLSFKGPGGEVRIKDPLPLRLVDSPLVIALFTIGFMVWGGYYLSFSDPESFLGPPLSPGHKNLQDNCFVCHVPFEPVPQYSCERSGCHAGTVNKLTHVTMPCKSCHPMHTGGSFDPESMAAAECDQCHAELAKDPSSIFHPEVKARRPFTNVPREIMAHRKHETTKYKCVQCHCLGKNTLKEPMEELFKMDTCLKCKPHRGDPPDCKECHNYKLPEWRFHVPAAKTEKRTCLRPEEWKRLVHKTRVCTRFREREPGHKNLGICGTDTPATEYSPPPPDPGPQEASDGDTADAGGQDAANDNNPSHNSVPGKDGASP